MSEYTNSPSPRKQGYVAGFSSFSQQTLMSMIDDVGLKMSAPELYRLSYLYRKELRRDAYLDELYMFDRLLGERRLLDSTIPSVDFNSDELAETFADMRAKAAAFNTRAAITLEDMFSLATDYLRRSGKRTSLDSTAAPAMLSSGRFADIELMLHGCKPAVHTDYAALGLPKDMAPPDEDAPDAAVPGAGRYTSAPRAVTPKKAPGITAAPPAGSLLVLVYPWGRISADDLHRLMSEVLSGDDGQNVLDGGILTSGGIIHWLESRGGAYIDLSTLSPIRDQVGISGLELLAHPLDGAVIAVLSADSANSFMAEAYKRRLWTSIIGCTASDNKLSVNCGPVTLSYPLTFLRQLTPIDDVCADLSASTACPGADTVREVTSTREGSYTLVSHRLTANETAHICFGDVRNAILSAVSECVASGSDFTDVCLSLDIAVASHGADDLRTRAEILEILLGAYRAQIKYCIPDIGSHIRLTDGEKSVTVCAASRRPDSEQSAQKLLGVKKRGGATAQKQPNIPQKISRTGSKVYLLAPALTGGGQVDYEDLRCMWRYVAQLAREGVILSAMAVTPDGVERSLLEMLPSELCILPSCDLAASDMSYIPGAILIEAADLAQRMNTNGEEKAKSKGKHRGTPPSALSQPQGKAIGTVIQRT